MFDFAFPPRTDNPAASRQVHECFFEDIVLGPAAPGPRIAHGLWFRAGTGISQSVNLAADMGGLRGRIRERNGAVEGDAGLLGAPELFQKCPARAVKIEIAVELGGKRL